MSVENYGFGACYNDTSSIGINAGNKSESKTGKRGRDNSSSDEDV